jgi:biopolymer transport protein ExbD
VMLVLLVIFLITAPMLTSSINLNLPNESAAAIFEQKTTTISLDKTGQYFFDDTPIEFENLKQKLATIAKENPKQPIHLRADVEVNYGKVSRVLSALQQLGLSNVGFVTEQK